MLDHRLDRVADNGKPEDATRAWIALAAVSRSTAAIVGSSPA